jgi:hypothetical protein
MNQLKVWIEGQKHPDTPRTAFLNCWQYDKVRRLLPARCRICNYVLSGDEKVVRELVFVCDDEKCACKRLYGAISHRVCFLCYDMWHSLYGNYGLKSMNYFKTIDEKEKAEQNDPKRRDRLGL